MTKLLLGMGIILMLPAIALADGDKRGAQAPKVVSGMSIVGNDETPKSLYLVPWKTATDGAKMDFSSSILNEDLKPVEKRQFIRDLELYQSSRSD